MPWSFQTSFTSERWGELVTELLALSRPVPEHKLIWAPEPVYMADMHHCRSNVQATPPQENTSECRGTSEWAGAMKASQSPTSRVTTKNLMTFLTFFFFLLKTHFHFVFLYVKSRLIRKCGIVFEEQLSAKPVMSSISKLWELVTSWECLLEGFWHKLADKQQEPVFLKAERVNGF